MLSEAFHQTKTKSSPNSHLSPDKRRKKKSWPQQCHPPIFQGKCGWPGKWILLLHYLFSLDVLTSLNLLWRSWDPCDQMRYSTLQTDALGSACVAACADSCWQDWWSWGAELLSALSLYGPLLLTITCPQSEYSQCSLHIHYNQLCNVTGSIKHQPFRLSHGSTINWYVCTTTWQNTIYQIVER